MAAGFILHAEPEEPVREWLICPLQGDGSEDPHNPVQHVAQPGLPYHLLCPLDSCVCWLVRAYDWGSLSTSLHALLFPIPTPTCSPAIE